MSAIKSMSMFAMILLALSMASCIQHAKLSEGTMPRPYPYRAAILRAVDIQVFRDGSDIEIVNHSPHSFAQFDLWINERFVRRIESLPAGQTRRVSLFDFVDEYSDAFHGGGLFAIERADPVVKAEIESADGLIGLIVIPEDRS